MIKIENLHAYYGAVEALKGVNIDIPSEKITCLIGANGAGKTTLLKSISGMIHHTGSIRVDDTEISPRRSLPWASSMYRREDTSFLD